MITRANKKTSRRTTKRFDCMFFFALFLLHCSPSFAQVRTVEKPFAAESSQTITFSSRSELVLVPVIVTDKKGEKIKGLNRESFGLRDDNAPRNIAVFEEVVASSAPIVAPRREPSVFSNDHGATSAKRLVILAFDAINTPVDDQIVARKQVLKFLSKDVDPNSLISLVVLTPAGLRVVHDFTSDATVLIKAVSKLHGKGDYSSQTPEATSVDDSEVQNEVAELSVLNESVSQSAIAGQKQLAIRWTYDALTQIAHGYESVPGRKSLIWITAGFPFSTAANNAQLSRVGGSGDVSDDLDAYQRMWSALSHANVAVYPVDARGFVNSGVLSASNGAKSASGKLGLPNMAVAQMSAHDASLDTLRDVAEMTGGKAFFNTNDLARSFREASEDSASYYLLGFYLPKDAKVGWHDLKVRINRSGAQVRARSGYLVATKRNTGEDKDEIRNALISPFDSTGLPLEVRWKGQASLPAAGKTKVTFDVMLSPSAITVDAEDNNHMHFMVIAVARHSDGTVAGTAQKTFDAHVTPSNALRFQKLGMFYEGTLELPPGQYMARFVVEDMVRGTIGSVSAPLTVN